jgi:hypothetical protein
VAWQRAVRVTAETYRAREDAIKHLVAVSPYTTEMEYKLFCRRREFHFYLALSRFVDVYFASQKDTVPPDRATMELTLYDDSLSMSDNEDRAGRFLVEWEVPAPEFFTGYVMLRSEFEKQFYVYGTPMPPGLAALPLLVFSNGLCYDPRQFQWRTQTTCWYDIMFTYGDEVLVVMEHTTELEPLG